MSGAMQGSNIKNSARPQRQTTWLARPLHQKRGQSPENLVASRVSIGVVHLFEMINVDHHDRHRQPFPITVGHFAAHEAVSRKRRLCRPVSGSWGGLLFQLSLQQLNTGELSAECVTQSQCLARLAELLVATVGNVRHGHRKR